MQKLFFSDVTEEALDKALREIEKDFESTKSGICLPRLKQIAENNVGIKKKMAIELTEMLYDLCQSEGGNFKLIKTYLGMHTGYLCISEVNALQEKSLSESSVTISVKPNRCRPLPVSTLTCYVQQIKSASPLQEMYLYFVKKLAEEKRGYIFDDLFEKLKEFQNILQALEIKNYPEARRLAESKRFATAQVATRALASWFSSSVEAQRKDPEKRSESHSYHDKKYALRSMTKQMFEKEYEEFKKFLKCREGRQNNAAEMKVYSIVKEVVVLELKRMKLRPVMQDKKDFVA